MMQPTGNVIKILSQKHEAELVVKEVMRPKTDKVQSLNLHAGALHEEVMEFVLNNGWELIGIAHIPHYHAGIPPSNCYHFIRKP